MTQKNARLATSLSFCRFCLRGSLHNFFAQAKNKLGMEEFMKFKPMFLSILLSLPAFADIRGDVRFCFDRYSSDLSRAAQCATDELARAVKNLQDLNGGNPTDVLTIEYQCGIDGARDTYSIIASGTVSSEIREKAQAQCKWSQFAAVKQWAEPQGSKSLKCQCGVDNASDTYSVTGFGLNYGEAYADAKASCKWTPIVKNCIRGDSAGVQSKQNVAKKSK
jgi:hypothetical protein